MAALLLIVTAQLLRFSVISALVSEIFCESWLKSALILLLFKLVVFARLVSLVNLAFSEAVELHESRIVLVLFCFLFAWLLCTNSQLVNRLNGRHDAIRGALVWLVLARFDFAFC